MTAAVPGPALHERIGVDDPRSLGRALSWIESAAPEGRDLLRSLYGRGGHAHVVGVTGPPGAGKSTLVSGLTAAFRALARTVAVIAVDPTSPYSGGAILGDRIRMQAHDDDSGVFIRSMATRGAQGGLCAAALDAVDVLDAAGFDVVIVETVGVGQDEVAVARGAHTVVLVSVPGLGDDIQTIKAGVMVIADIHVVNKADRPGADRIVADLRRWSVGAPEAPDVWTTPVVATSAATGDGLHELTCEILRHHEHAVASGELDRRRALICEARVVSAAETMFARRLRAIPGAPIEPLVRRVVDREIDPHTAAAMLLGPSPARPDPATETETER